MYIFINTGSFSHRDIWFKTCIAYNFIIMIDSKLSKYNLQLNRELKYACGCLS